MKIVDMIMKFAPLGLGAYFANLVGEFGPQLIGDYGRCMLIYYPMCIVYGVVFFPLYAYFAGGKKGVKAMAKMTSNYCNFHSDFSSSFMCFLYVYSKIPC